MRFISGLLVIGCGVALAALVSGCGGGGGGTPDPTSYGSYTTTTTEGITTKVTYTADPSTQELVQAVFAVFKNPATTGAGVSLDLVRVGTSSNWELDLTGFPAAGTATIYNLSVYATIQGLVQSQQIGVTRSATLDVSLSGSGGGPPPPP